MILFYLAALIIVMPFILAVVMYGAVFLALCLAGVFSGLAALGGVK